MRILSDKEREVLGAFCDTIHPSGQDRATGDANCSLSASDLGVTELVETVLRNDQHDASDWRQLRLLLTLLQRRTVNGVLAGHWAPFTKLSVEQRTDVLLAMANSQFNQLRGAFHGVKRLVSFLAYSADTEQKGNPYWQLFEYQGRAKPVSRSDSLATVDITSSQTLTCDVLVIGSGAGGSVVAAELAAAGQDVIVVEKGDYFSNDQLPDNELDGMRLLYEKRGAMRTADRGMVVLAGSTLGGGTTVNWMTCLRPPLSLLNQWSDQFGFHEALSADFARSLDYVSQRIHVTSEESHANFQNEAMERGCRRLGYDCTVISRNVKGCVKCDFCSFGCRYGAKQDTRRTFLQDAVELGARIIVRANVDRVTHRQGEATGAEITVRDEDGHRLDLIVKSKMVVVSAGAIHTPALLMRSGLRNRHIGANLQLHPVGAVFARYEERVQAWHGAPQTRLCEHFADLDGDGYGVRLEASPAHPGLWALGLPWQGGEHFQSLMQQIPHLANMIVLTRDKFAGRVELNSRGKPVLHYKLHPYDAKHLTFGLEQALRIHRAAGAQMIYGPNNDCLAFDCRQNDAALDRYLQQIQNCGVRPNYFGLFCAHQMSSCRIADSANRGAVDPSGECYDVRNLFVADGSVLPTSTGVNPMLTILSVAHHLAQHIKAKLPVG